MVSLENLHFYTKTIAYHYVHNLYICRFDNSNVEELMKCLSKEERKVFGFDVSSLDWKDYVINVHFPGIRKHIMKERILK